jgi:hypothetical protein
MPCIKKLLARRGGRASWADGLRVWKPAIPQTWKSAVQQVRQQLRDVPQRMKPTVLLLNFLPNHYNKIKWESLPDF